MKTRPLNSPLAYSNTKSELTGVILVITSALALLFLAVAGPGVYFADELIKYVSLIILLLSMILFSLMKGFYKSYVFFSCISININFAILYLFYPQDSAVIANYHFIMIPDLFILLGFCFLIVLPPNQLNSGETFSFSTVKFYIVLLWYLFVVSIYYGEEVYAMSEVFNYSRVLMIYLVFKLVLVREPKAWEYIFFGLAVLIIAQGIVGILQQFGVDIFLRFTDASFNYEAGSFNRIGGTLGRVQLHSLLTLTLPALLAIAIWLPWDNRKLLMSLALFLGTIALALTRNRGPALATIIGFGYVFYKLCYHRVIEYSFKLIICGFLVLIILICFFSIGGRNLEEILNRPTHLGRLYQYKYVVETVLKGKARNLIFGFGPNQYILNRYGLKSAFKSYRTPKTPQNIHNQYLLVFYEFGIVGLTLYLFWLFSFFNKTRIRNKYRVPLLGYAEICKIGIRGSLVSLFFVLMTEWPHGNVYFTVLGIYMAILAVFQGSTQELD